MTKVVTIRVVLDDERVDHFIGVLDSRDILEFAVDSVVETHTLPKFIDNALINGTYNPGDFNRDIIVANQCGVPGEPGANRVFTKNMNDYDASTSNPNLAVRYKYDTLPAEGVISNPVEMFPPDQE